jgi:acetolactate synthase-1/2/3 large subunit
VLSGLIDALFAKSPVVALASDVKAAVQHRFAYQELDQTAMFRPAVKWGARVERAERLPDLLRTAIREAVTGCPGPTYLGLPSDLLVQPVDRPPGELFLDPPAYLAAAPAAGAVEMIVAELERAARPVVLAGTGVVSSRAFDALRVLVETLGLPVVTSVGGKGAIAETHPLAFGVAGRYSRWSSNAVLGRADLVLAFGSRLNDMATDDGRLVADDARVVHVDVDPSALGRTQAETVSVVGDAATTLAAVRDAAGARAGAYRDRWVEWRTHCERLRDEWLLARTRLEEELRGTSPVSPVSVVAALREVLDPDDVVVADTGYMAAWTSALYDVCAAGLTHLRTAGSLGWALPAAIGAQLALPEGRRVVAVTGDGGIGYHLAELETALRLDVPIVVVVMNNGTLAFERHSQARLLGRVVGELVDFADVDYAAAAIALGGHGARVDAESELVPALRRALAAGRPALLDVRVEPGAEAPVTKFERLGPRPL